MTLMHYIWYECMASFRIQFVRRACMCTQIFAYMFSIWVRGVYVHSICVVDLWVHSIYVHRQVECMCMHWKGVHDRNIGQETGQIINENNFKNSITHILTTKKPLLEDGRTKYLLCKLMIWKEHLICIRDTVSIDIHTGKSCRITCPKLI